MVITGQLDFDTDSRVRKQISLVHDKSKLTTCFLLERESRLVQAFADKSILYRSGNRILSRIRLIYNLYLLTEKDKVLYVHDEKVLLEVCILFQLRSNLKLIYDDHELKNIRESSCISRIYFQLEKYAYRISSRVIVATSQRQKLCRVIYDSKKIEVIENSVHNSIYSKTFSVSRQELDIQESSKVIVHQGRLLESRGKSLIRRCIEKDPHIVWLLLGPGSNEFDHYSNVKNVGLVSNENVLAYWKIADYSFIFYDCSTLNNKYCAPNRLYMAMQFKLPVICNSNPGIHHIGREMELINVNDWLNGKS